jgi:hypothetical protein
MIQVHVHRARDHSSLAFADTLHVELPITFGNPEFLTSPDVRRNFGAVDDVLARKAGDVRARTAEGFPLDDRRLHPLFSQSPGEEFPRRSVPRTSRSYSSAAIEPFQKYCGRAERGFLALGEA